jgi:hypothetical protein
MCIYDRRSILKTAGIAAAAMLGGASATLRAYAAALTAAQRDTLTPDAVLAMMKKGNERFRLGKESPHDFLAQQKASAKRAVSGCDGPQLYRFPRACRRSSSSASVIASTRGPRETSQTTTSSEAWSSHARWPAQSSSW